MHFIAYDSFQISSLISHRSEMHTITQLDHKRINQINRIAYGVRSGTIFVFMFSCRFHVFVSVSCYRVISCLRVVSCLRVGFMSSCWFHVFVSFRVLVSVLCLRVVSCLHVECLRVVSCIRVVLCLRVIDDHAKDSGPGAVLPLCSFHYDPLRY